MKIGTFVQSPEGELLGRIHGLGFVTVAVTGEPQTSRDGKDYFRLIADPARDAYEIGVAFAKQKDGRTYYSVNIDSPMFPQPVNAALFQDKGNPGVFNLIWNRPETQDARPEKVSNPAHRQARTPNLSI